LTYITSFLFHLPTSHGATAPGGPGPSLWRGFIITLRHTTFGRTSLDGWSARRRNLYLTTPSTLNGHISMPAAGFETTISASERPQTHALDRATSVIGHCSYFVRPTAQQCKQNGRHARFTRTVLFVILCYTRPNDRRSLTCNTLYHDTACQMVTWQRSRNGFCLLAFHVQNKKHSRWRCPNIALYSVLYKLILPLFVKLLNTESCNAVLWNSDNNVARLEPFTLWPLDKTCHFPWS